MARKTSHSGTLLAQGTHLRRNGSKVSRSSQAASLWCAVGVIAANLIYPTQGNMHDVYMDLLMAHLEFRTESHSDLPERLVCVPKY